MKLRSGHVAAIQRRALGRGGSTVSPISVTWAVAGRCEAPVPMLIKGHREYGGPAGPHEVNRYIDMEVPCRKCRRCLAARGAHWRLRATAETKASARTWFVTLTLSPSEHYRIQMLATARAKHRATGDFEYMSEREQFAARHREISMEIGLFMKRLRAASGAKLRFVCVAEAHKSGLPHYHALIHEQPGSPPLRHRHIGASWKLGFVNAKLADEKSAWYVTKYLTKAAMARVRASLRYGDVQTVTIVKSATSNLANLSS